MRRSRIAAAAVLLGTTAGGVVQSPVGPSPLLAAPLQPPKGRPPVVFGQPAAQLKGTDRTAAQDAATLAGWWASKLVADIDQLKFELAAARINPAAKKVASDRADAALLAAVTLQQAIATNARPQWGQRFNEVEAAVNQLNIAVGQNVGNVPAVTTPLTRARYDVEQLGVSLMQADAANAVQLKRFVERLSKALEEQADRLHEALHNVPNVTPELDRTTRMFVRAAIRFDVGLELAPTPEVLKRNIFALSTAWNEVLSALSRMPNLPPQVRYQANRVDGLYRKLGELTGVAPPPPPNPGGPGPGQPAKKLSVLAVGAEAGMPPRVVVYADDNGTVAHSFDAYSKDIYKQGVRVAVADLNGDGQPEVVTVPGGGKLGRVWVFDGRDMSPLLNIDAFNKKEAAYGYNVAAHDLTADGRAPIAVAPDAGGPPAVEVYDLALGKMTAQFVVFDQNFRGGVRLAWGDVNGDGAPELIATSGPGPMPSRVKVYDGKNFNRTLVEFDGVDAKYTGGLWVAAANLSRQNNKAEIVVGLDAGSRPAVRVFEGATGKFLGEALPYPATFRGGVRVAAGDPDDAGDVKVIVSPGPGGNNLPIKVIEVSGKTHAELNPFPGVNRGMFVGSR